MKSIVLCFMILIASRVFADEADFIGTWNIKPVDESKDQFPFWMDIKYPKVFVFKRVDDVYAFSFTDQFGDTCSGNAMPVNRNEELVFEYCGGLGTKKPRNWAPVFHFKIIDGQLHGVVTSNMLLFKLVGTRQ